MKSFEVTKFLFDQAALFGELLAISQLFFTRDESPNKAPCF